MNLDKMTYGELKQIAAIFCNTENKKNHPMIGRFCIARCYSAGVHAGIVSDVDGENVILKDSRRLWNWEANDGIALSGLAQNGLKSGKVDTLNPDIYLTGVCELIPCTENTKRSIYEA